MDSRTDKNKIKKYKDDFVTMAHRSKAILEEEGVTLTFKGYSDTIVQYLNCDEFDITGLENMMKDLNLWCQYFGDLEALVENLFLKRDNMRMYADAFIKTPKNIEITKQKEKEVIILKMFLRHLKIQKKMFGGFSSHCYDMYNSACESFKYRA